MKNIRKIYAVWKFQMISKIINIKTLIIFLIMFLYIRAYEEPIMDFLKAVGIGIEPYLYPILMNDIVFPIIILLGYLILVCDAPFIGNGYLFLVARCGKKSWIIGESLFMLSYSALYTLSMYVFTIINFGTKIEFGTSWGKAILTLTRTDAAQQFGIHDFNQTVVENYMPIEATAKTIFLCTLLLWFIGMLVFALNYLLKNQVGVLLAAMIIFGDLAIYNFFSDSLYRFSPVSLMKLSVITGVNQWNPTFLYATSVLIGGSLILMAIEMVSAKFTKGKSIDNRRQR